MRFCDPMVGENNLMTFPLFCDINNNHGMGFVRVKCADLRKTLNTELWTQPRIPKIQGGVSGGPFLLLILTSVSPGKGGDHFLVFATLLKTSCVDVLSSDFQEQTRSDDATFPVASGVRCAALNKQA